MIKKKYWWLVFLVVLSCLVWPAWADNTETTKKIKIVWQDNNVKTEDFQWLLFVRGEGESFGDPVMTIPIAGAVLENDEYESPVDIFVTGTPGGVVRKYIALKAQRGEEISDFSEEAHIDFSIPLAAPYGITINIVISSE